MRLSPAERAIAPKIFETLIQLKEQAGEETIAVLLNEADNKLGQLPGVKIEYIQILDEETLQMFNKYGHGKAPERSCGAYYAAEFLLSGHRSELISSLKEHFTKEAEYLNCRKIRRGKHLSCEGCVDNIARFLSLQFPAVGDDEKAVQARFDRRNL